MEENSFPVVILTNPTPSCTRLIIYESVRNFRNGFLQKGPRCGWIFSTAKPIVPMKMTNNHTPRHRKHRKSPVVLFSATHGPHLRPPVNNTKVWTAMTNDQIAEATSPELIKNPCIVHRDPEWTEFLMRESTTVTSPRAWIKSYWS